ncbi:MAG: hypothetical protein RL525_121 [Bacteroidota bacterium]|jgi:hypothetical protein
MKKLFSLEKLTQGIRLSLTKYPISILFAAIAAMLLIVITAAQGNDMEDIFAYIIGCGMGISLFFAIHTALENKTWPGYVKGLVMVMGLGILWLIVSDIKNQMDSGSDQSQAIQIFGYGLLTHLVVAFLPFIGNFKINAFWQYNKSLFIRAFTTVLYTGVLFAGISGAILAITQLFDVDFGSKIYAYLWFIMALPMSVIIFCAGVPTDINELESSTDLPKGLRIFVQFILIPLVVLYLLILYAYMGKIIVQWSLPQGWVTILIMVFSVLGMLAMLLVHPYQNQKENSWVKWYTKGYYVALLPLLILQYVAIFTRIGDYGFTAPRWAVLAITFWLTWITLYNVFFKGRNIVLIPLTLFITAFLFLLGPLSHKSISISSQTAKINRLLTELKLVKNGKLLVYKDNPKTDSLMGELYSATRYLNRNYQKTGLEPYLKYPTEAEIQKQTYIEKASTSPGSTNRNQIMDRYNRRQDIRQILSDDLEKFNIHSYDSDRETATSTWFEIESQIPQNLIPAGNWTHYYPIEDIYMNEDYESTVSSRPDFIKIKRNKGATNGDVGSNVTLIVNGEEIEIPIQNALASDLKNRMRSAEFNILKVPNNKLLFPFKKNGQEGIFVVEKINYDVFETNGANPNNLKIDRITGCIFMK